MSAALAVVEPAGSGLGKVSEPVLIRTSAGMPNGARVRVTGTARGYVTIAPGAAYAGPVVWCCDASNTEVVVSSDGRDDAPHPVGAGLDGDRVRWIASGAAGAVLGAGSPVEGDLRETSISIPGNPGPFQASIAQGVAAWADRGGSTLRLGVPSDTDMGSMREVPQGGQVKSVLATSTYVATVVRAGGRTKVLRTPVAGGAPRTIWTGSGTPQVAMSGGAIAIGSGTTVLTSRSGGTAKKAYTAKGPIAAVATDGKRVVVFERITRKIGAGKRARTVKSTVGRVIGGMR